MKPLYLMEINRQILPFYEIEDLYNKTLEEDAWDTNLWVYNPSKDLYIPFSECIDFDLKSGDTDIIIETHSLTKDKEGNVWAWIDLTPLGYIPRSPSIEGHIQQTFELAIKEVASMIALEE